MSIKFRALNADEVDCKVKQVKKNGVMILLYKDARVDQRLLDEVVGPENWQRKHMTINNNLFCSVGIYIAQRDEWVWKQDVGTESATEAEKGQASDSFKRACFNWGIGRELYTAPFIWIPADRCEITPSRDTFKCYDRFVCTSMEVNNGTITALEIYNQTRKTVAYRYGYSSPTTQADEQKNQDMIARGNASMIDDVKKNTIVKEIKKKGLTENSILQYYKLTTFDNMTLEMWNNAMKLLSGYPDRA